MAASVLNLLGYTIGVILYAMLLWMVVRSHPPDQKWSWSKSDHLLLLTGVLGLFWNLVWFSAFGLYTAGVEYPPPLLLAGAFSALGFLPAVIVHSVLRSREKAGRWMDRCLLIFAYLLSSVAAVMHISAALSWRISPSQTALEIETGGFAIVIVALLFMTRKTPGWGRAAGIAGLAVFAVSALHLANHHGADPWWLVLVGHHASLPLALAILHQDYRFALADILLKRALAFLLMVSLVFGVYVVGAAPLLAHLNSPNGGADQQTILMLLALWVATAMVYPWIRNAANWFVDNVVLERPDYEMMLTEAARLINRHETVDPILEEVRQLMSPALSAPSLHWEKIGEQNSDVSRILPLQVAANRSAIALIPTADPPYYSMCTGELAGGRRLLSDDVAVIEKLALLVARRIDVVRTEHERFERNLREQEMSRLTAEAELTALRAQIHPHFLFNALTTIGYLIQTAPDRALNTLMRLSSLLRGVLQSSREFVSLGDEIGVVEAYLDIERARFEDRLSVTIDVPEELRSLCIPSFLLQPLVENALKHGISKLSAGGRIRIAAGIPDDDSVPRGFLRLIVEDTGAGADDLQFAAGRSRGVGLNNIERRLKCYGDGTAYMNIASQRGRGTHVEVVLPAETLAGDGERTAAFSGRAT